MVHGPLPLAATWSPNRFSGAPKLVAIEGLSMESSQQIADHAIAYMTAISSPITTREAAQP
jgi:hypothetical protein